MRQAGFGTLLLGVAVTLASCGGSEPTTSSPVESVAPTETPSPPASAPVAVVDPAIQAQIDALPAPYNEASYRNGRRQYKTCQTCHLLDPEAGNRVGPNLHGLFERNTAALDDFNYSAALREADFAWTPERLDEWLANPRSFLPGNRMSFAGLRRPNDRRDVIAYLMIETAPAPTAE